MILSTQSDSPFIFQCVVCMVVYIHTTEPSINTSIDKFAISFLGKYIPGRYIFFKIAFLLGFIFHSCYLTL